MEPFATVQDVIDLFRPLTEEEARRAGTLLPAVSDLLRQYAMNAGRDLDAMVASGKLLPGVLKSVTVDVTARALVEGGAGESILVSQESQGALGYTASRTYLNPGGGIFVKDAELKRLGILRQRMGVSDFVQHD